MREKKSLNYINKYASEKNLTKRNKVVIGGEDIKEGLTAILSVKMPDPKFSSQTKDKLVSSEVRPIVESIVSENLGNWFEENPKDSKTVISKIFEAAAAREAARKAREVSRKNSALEISSLHHVNIHTMEEIHLDVKHISLWCAWNYVWKLD